MKVQGNLEASASLIYAKQIYQKSSKTNAVVVDQNPGVFDKVFVDFDNGNVQSIDLSLSTTDVVVSMTNPKVGAYMLSIQQHAAFCRNLSFSPSIESKFDMKKVSTSGIVVLALYYDGTKFINSDNSTAIYIFDETENYGENVIAIKDNTIYLSLGPISAGQFNENQWEVISTSNASKISYEDIYSSGSTNIQDAISFAIARNSLDLIRYETIDEMLEDSANQKTTQILRVANVSIGANRDSRATSGFAYYIKTSEDAVTISEYDIISQLVAPSTRTSFDNTIAEIPNSPNTVKKAIDELSKLVESSSSGQNYLDNWNATSNERLIASNAYYDDSTKNPIILLYNSASNIATVSSSECPTNLVSGSKVRIYDHIHNIIIEDIVVETVTVSADKKLLKFVTNSGNIMQGYRILTANKLAKSGDYFYVNVAGTSSIDGNEIWAVGDKIMSNGVKWNKIAAFSVVVKNKVVLLTLNQIGAADFEDNLESKILEYVLTSSMIREAGVNYYFKVIETLIVPVLTIIDMTTPPEPDTVIGITDMTTPPEPDTVIGITDMTTP